MSRRVYLRRRVVAVWVFLSVTSLAAMAFGLAAGLPVLGILGTAGGLAATLLGVYEIARAEDEGPPHEWRCAACDATNRAPMADPRDPL